MILHLVYTPDLTEAGALYARRMLALGMIHASNTDLTAVRQAITDIAAELAFRRYLNEHHIPYQAAQAAPFSQPDRRVLFLAGRRCHLINTSFRSPSSAPRLEDSASALLNDVASLSAAHLNSDRLEHTDLLIFSFTPLKPLSRQPSSPARIAHPGCYLYLLPQAWLGKSLSGQGRTVTIENQGNSEIKLELGGTLASAQELSLEVTLAAGQPTEITDSVSSLTYLATGSRPPAGMGLHLTCEQRRLRIMPEQWVNIGQNAEEILLAGYRSVGDFRQHAQGVYAARPLHTGARLPPQAVYLPIAQLAPVSELFR